jgi:hypothetical protein
MRCAVSSSRSLAPDQSRVQQLRIEVGRRAFARSSRPSASAAPTALPCSTSTRSTAASVSIATPRAAHSLRDRPVIAPMPPIAWPQTPVACR